MAQAVEAPSAMDGMADDERRQKLFSLSSVFVPLTNGSRPGDPVFFAAGVPLRAGGHVVGRISTGYEM